MRVAVGTMQWGAAVSEDEAGRIFDAAVERGVRLFDTAPIYQDGEAERILGRCLKRCTHTLHVMTKGGYSTQWTYDELTESLRRLGTDHIGTYFLHRPMLQGDVALERFCNEAGHRAEVGHLGLSNAPAWLAATFRRCIDALQPLYNLLRRQAEVEILPFAQQKNARCYPYSPLAMGLLGGGGERAIHDKRYRKRYPERPPRILPGDALRWVMAHPAVTAPIVGPSSVQQLTDLLDCAECPMVYGDHEYRALSALTSTPPPAHDRLDDLEVQP